MVHGAGEGILRRAVRDFLAAHREVTAFHAADLARGGDNVTIIEMRGNDGADPGRQDSGNPRADRYRGGRFLLPAAQALRGQPPGSVPVPRRKDPLLQRQRRPADLSLLRLRGRRKRLLLPDAHGGALLSRGACGGWRSGSGSRSRRRASRPAEEERREEAGAAGRINEVAADFYHRMLMEEPEGAPARRYLKERGYDREAAEQFRLGFAPDRWEALAEASGRQRVRSRTGAGAARAGPPRQAKGGATTTCSVDGCSFRFSDSAGTGGRLRRPGAGRFAAQIHQLPRVRPSTTRGGLSTVSIRPRRGCGRPGRGSWSRATSTRWPCTGPGSRNAVATCGTALTAEHARLLKRYAKRLLLLFDQDSAGQQGDLPGDGGASSPKGCRSPWWPSNPGKIPTPSCASGEPRRSGERLAAARPVLEVFIESASGGPRRDASRGGRGRWKRSSAKLRLLPDDIERSLYLPSPGAATRGSSEDLLRRAPPSAFRRAFAAGSGRSGRASRLAPSAGPAEGDGGGDTSPGTAAALMLDGNAGGSPEGWPKKGWRNFFSDEDRQADCRTAARCAGAEGESPLQRAAWMTIA